MTAPVITRDVEQNGEYGMILTREVAKALHRGALEGEFAVVNVKDKYNVSFWVNGECIGTLPRKYLVE